MQAIKYFILTGLFLIQNIVFLSGQSNAPGLPQRSGTIMATQALHFGDISIVSGSSGGTVTISHNGMRSSTGNVILLNLGNIPRQAIFEYKLCPGRMVNITFPPMVTLTGERGGTLFLQTGPTNLGPSGSSFISNKGCDDTHYIHMGGTLEVKGISSNPGGLYTGSINITFIQE